MTIRDLMIFLCLNNGLSSKLMAQTPGDSITKSNTGQVSVVFGKGVQFKSGDGRYSLTIGGRLQTMAEVKFQLTEPKVISTDFLVRRCRLSFTGTAFDPRFSFRLQLGFSSTDISASNSSLQNNMIIRDAMLFYKLRPWLILGLGQTKLPGNRQRQVSSGNLQLVERSIVNTNFTLDRDKGVWITSNFKSGKSVFKAVAAISSGEGRINSSKNGKVCYTGRIEWLPLGNFSENGDFVEASQFREPTSKFSLGVVASDNIAAVRTLGQLGEYLYNGESADISYWGADMMYKKKGFSALVEWYSRAASKGVIVNSENPSLSNYVLSGNGLLIQTGLFISSKSEIAARYATIHPSQKLKGTAPEQRELVIGFNHYFHKHNLKLQTDLSYLKTGSDKSLIYRLSGIVAF